MLVQRILLFGEFSGDTEKWRVDYWIVSTVFGTFFAQLYYGEGRVRNQAVEKKTFGFSRTVGALALALSTLVLSGCQTTGVGGQALPSNIDDAKRDYAGTIHE